MRLRSVFGRGSCRWGPIAAVGTAGIVSTTRGRKSADRVHPEWHSIKVGDRFIGMPDGSRVVEVAAVEPERFLALRASIDLRGHPFDPHGPRPRYFTDSTWCWVLEPLPSGRTRVIESGYWAFEPRWLQGLVSALFIEPEHWVMQTHQFANLKRLAEGTTPITSVPARRTPTPSLPRLRFARKRFQPISSYVRWEVHLLISRQISRLLPRRNATAVKTLLACGIASSIVYVAADVVGSLRYSGYSHRDQAFSELTAQGSPVRTSTIATNAIPYTLLVLGFAAGVWLSSHQTRIAHVTGGLIAGYAIVGLIGAFVFPMNTRGTDGTLRNALHIPATALMSLCILAP